MVMNVGEMEAKVMEATNGDPWCVRAAHGTHVRADDADEGARAPLSCKTLLKGQSRAMPISIDALTAHRTFNL
jgi:hypothetical protein